MRLTPGQGGKHKMFYPTNYLHFDTVCRSYQPRSEFDDRPGTSAYPAYDDRPARAAYRGYDDRPVRAAYGAYDSRSERATGSVYDNRPARTTYSVHEVTDYGRPHQHPPRQGTADPYARR